MNKPNPIHTIGLKDFIKLLLGETHETLLNWMQKSRDLVRLPFFKNIYIIHSPEIARFILQRVHKDIDKDNFLNKRLNQVFGQGILSSEGQQWLNERRLMQPAFHKDRVGQILSQINDLIDLQLFQWTEQTKSNPVIDSVPNDLRRLTMMVVGHAIGFNNNSKINEILALMQKGAELISNSIPVNLPEWVPFTSFNKLKKMNAQLEKFLLEVIAENELADNPNSIINMLNEGLTDMNDTEKRLLILDEVKSILLAGIFTTSDSILWIIYTLETNRDIKKSFIKSIQTGNLDYIQACINESLRLNPAVWSIWYHARRDIQVSNYFIPEDAVIIINLYNIHRNPDFYSDADKFIPDRFLSDETSATFIPYGFGPRKCIGAHLAQTFITEFITRLYGSFHIEMLNNEMDSTVRITISQKNNLLLRLTPL